MVNSPSRGTFANASARLAVGLADTAAVRPTLLCYSAEPAPASLERAVRIDRLPVERASRALFSLVHYLRQRQPDILVTRQVHANLVGIAAAHAARMHHGWRGKLIVGHDHPAGLSHASDWKDNKWLVKASYPSVDGLITPSPALRDDILEWCHLSPAAVAVVPIPITPFTATDDAPPHPWLHPGGPPVFVTTARLVGYKRIDRLIEAFHALSAQHDCRLLVIGSGPKRATLEAHISRLGLGSRVETLGWVADPRQFMAWARGFVLPSEQEGFSQVLTEAMSVGCPVISTDADGGGPRFITEHGRHGLLVPRNDNVALRTAMETLLDDATRARYAGLARRRAEAFSPRACAAALLQFVHTVASRQGRQVRFSGPLRSVAGHGRETRPRSAESS